MLRKKIKWYLLFENKSLLDEQFLLRNTSVYKNFSGEYLLVKDGENYFAFKNRCPHQNKALNGCEVADGNVVCPHHKYEFSCENGRGNGLYLEKYELRFENDKVFVGMEKWSWF